MIEVGQIYRRINSDNSGEIIKVAKVRKNREGEYFDEKKLVIAYWFPDEDRRDCYRLDEDTFLEVFASCT